MDLPNICQQVRSLAVTTGQFIAGELNKVEANDIEEKYHNNLVSYVDTTAEKMLVSGLTKILPQAGFITEENTTEQTSKALTWMVDPLDGTTNFLYKIPVFAVSIALVQNERVVLGVVYEVNRAECFWAYTSSGAYVNDTPIRVRKNSNLNDALLATGFPYYKFNAADEYMRIFTHLMTHTRGLRRLGAAAVDLCYVACGRFDAYFEQNLSPWDIAGGSIIVQEAGGIVSNFEGNNQYLDAKSIVAANSVYPSLMQVINENMETDA